MLPAAKLLQVIKLQTEIAKLGLDLGEVMTLVTERTLELLQADGAAIEMVEGDEMVYRAVAGSAKPQIGLRLKRESSLSGLCVRTGEPLRCDDAETDPRVDKEACRKVGLRSMIVLPLVYRDEPVGVLKAMSSQPAHFSAADVMLLELLSGLVAAMMYFATKYSDDDLFHRATHDDLTGLANRALFMDRLRNVLARCQREQGTVGVLMIDMDGLKRINDTRGHSAGDAMIREFAARLRGWARTSDTVARLGGDEFAVILDPVEGEDGVDAAVDRLAFAIETPFAFKGEVFALRASIGSAQFPSDSDDVLALLDLADQRMYRTKREHQGLRLSPRLH